MPTPNKKVIFYATAEIVAWLAAETERTGAPVAELCRRALRLAAFGEAQTSRVRLSQPVLITKAGN